MFSRIFCVFFSDGEQDLLSITEAKTSSITHKIMLDLMMKMMSEVCWLPIEIFWESFGKVLGKFCGSHGTVEKSKRYDISRKRALHTTRD